ncbi:MAG: cytochrome c oxidase subunit II [Methylobacter sp.]
MNGSTSLFTAATSTIDYPIAPLNYFLHSYGPSSMPILHLGWAFAALLTLIFIIISFLLIWAVLRKRSADEPAAIEREDKGMLWIYIGTGLSTCILFALAIYMLATLNKTSKPAQAPVLTFTATGYDWWWKIEYNDEDPSRRFVTANEIHIPVGQPVLVKLKSADVIHAFWVPVLAGKTQMIPGLTNQQWLQADAEGVYLGRCTQYCGVQHAHMAFEVVAQNAADFQRWQDAQRQTAAGAPPEAAAGWKIFLDQCAGCHAVRGTEAVGAHAPDLTHLNSRRLLAGGLLTNTPEHVRQWITHAQQLKPGSRMPSMVLTVEQADALSAYLSTLN